MDVPKVIFQDEDILVLNKPSGLISAKTDTKKEVTLEDLLNKEFGLEQMGGGLAHRLDKNTSGLLLVGKNKNSLDNLQDQFKNRAIKKEYWALVHGRIENKGKVEGAIGRNPVKHDKFSMMKDGREAVTEYEPIRQLVIDDGQLTKIFISFNKIQIRKLWKMDYGKFTLLLCRPKTGRTHQIRVHLKYINHPIVSDEKYAGRKIFKLDKEWCPRLFLHAKKINFYHPSSGEWMEFESPLPEDLELVLDRLKNE